MGYFRKRYHPPGTAPGTLIAHPEAERHPPSLSVIDFTPAALEQGRNLTVADCRTFLDRPSVTWIHVQGHPDAGLLNGLAELFDLHPLALEDVVNSGQRPKLELYSGQFFVTLSLPALNGSHTEVEQISLFMGEGFVVSFCAGPVDPFGAVRKRLQSPTSRVRNRRADYLLYALLDAVIDQGFPLLERLGERIEDLELDLLDRPDQQTLAGIHALKRDLLVLRRMLWPHREVINLLLREDSPLLVEETRLYLRDCYDHSIQILELLESYRDMAAGMLDVYLSSASNRLNEVMRLLTVISTIFIPLTFVAGVYGMNFGRDTPRSPWAMPELDWAYGYPVVWLVMLAMVVGMVAYFKYRRWF